MIATAALTLWLISWPLRTSKAASDEIMPAIVPQLAKSSQQTANGNQQLAISSWLLASNSLLIAFSFWLLADC
jgi:hypothetical protein